MTLLAGGVAAVEAGEVLESLRGYGAHHRLTAAEDGNHPGAAANSRHSVALSVKGAAPSQSGTVQDRPFYPFFKRAIDVVGSLAALVFLSPLIAAIAVLTKLTDGGSVFYPHTRIGKWGREFKCYKFRTMVMNADSIKADIAHLNTHDDHRTFKMPDDPRVTRIGRWLRRASIDEVPQLWNVFLGDMSLVGPRPPVPQEVERYDLDDMQRLMVKPGLTCIWQVSGRSRLPFPEQLAMDLAYIEKRSIWLDVKLMALTLPAVVSADGAY